MPGAEHAQAHAHQDHAQHRNPLRQDGPVLGRLHLLRVDHVGAAGLQDRPPPDPLLLLARRQGEDEKRVSQENHLFCSPSLVLAVRLGDVIPETDT